MNFSVVALCQPQSNDNAVLSVLLGSFILTQVNMGVALAQW